MGRKTHKNQNHKNKQENKEKTRSLVSTNGHKRPHSQPGSERAVLVQASKSQTIALRVGAQLLESGCAVQEQKSTKESANVGLIFQRMSDQQRRQHCHIAKHT